MTQLYLPLYGITDVPNFPIISCHYKVNDELENKQYKKLIRSIAQKNIDHNHPCAVNLDNDILSIGNPLSLDELKDNRIKDVKITKIQPSEFPKKFSEIISYSIREFYLNRVVFHGRDLIFKGRPILDDEINGLKIKLEQHESVRFAPYVNRDFTKFAIMIYPSYKLSLWPTIDQMIDNGINVDNLFARSTRDGFPSGQIKGILNNSETDIRKYRNNSREIRERYNQDGCEPPNDPPIINIKIRKEKRDVWEFSHIYRLQVRFDLFNSDTFLKWDLEDLHNHTNFTPDKFYNTIEKFRKEIDQKISKWRFLD